MSFKYLICALGCGLLLSACAGPPPKRNAYIQPMVSQEIREAAMTRDFLLDGFDEDAPVRLFGYVLFPRGILLTNGQYDSLQQAIAKVFWNSLAPQNHPEKITRSGMTYWLAHKTTRNVLYLAALDQDWKTLLNYYHVERSALILNRLQTDVTQPVLVVATEPLGQAAGAYKGTGEKVLILDLSLVLEGKLTFLLQKYQKEIMEKRGQVKRLWNKKYLYSCFRPFFGKQTKKAVIIKTLD